ncbi:MAG: hypothetical protein P4L50_08285 [Anaerolineaceae bacterium]|nr:hypothetical protein [Anaerolineaceae bacterium]
MMAVIIVGKFEKNQAKNGRRILAGFEVRIGAQIVGGAPKVRFELFKLVTSHCVNG